MKKETMLIILLLLSGSLMVHAAGPALPSSSKKSGAALGFFAATANPLQCSYCPRVLTRPSHVTKHKRVHTGERPFPCPVCSYKAAVKHTLEKHLRRHTGERPYTCNKPGCGMTFTQLSTCNRHERNHLKIKTHVCDICGKSFNRVSHLKTHGSVHGLVPPRKKGKKKVKQEVKTEQLKSDDGDEAENDSAVAAASPAMPAVDPSFLITQPVSVPTLPFHVGVQAGASWDAFQDTSMQTVEKTVAHQYTQTDLWGMPVHGSTQTDPWPQNGAAASADGLPVRRASSEGIGEFLGGLGSL